MKNFSKRSFFTPRLVIAFAFCSAGAALAMLGLTIPPVSQSDTERTSETSIPSLLARPGEHEGGQNVNIHKLIAMSQWFPALAPAGRSKGGVSRKGPTTVPASFAPAGPQLTPFVSQAVVPKVSAAVRDLPSKPTFTISTGQRDEEGELSNRKPRLPRDPLERDPVVQTGVDAIAAMPPVIASFEGLNITSACGSCLPPDTVGAVGPNHYVQMVNSNFAIYSKTGTELSPPKPINALWSAIPNSTCATHNNGDPIVIYDQLADRWLLSQFTVQSATENYAECIAISQTPDPTGAYWLYQFDESADTFHDYPHIGIWPDGYYMTTNLFPNDALLTSTGAGAWAFERPKMLLGQPARYVYFDETPLATETYTPGGQLPTSLEGKTLPPAGAPNYFVEVNDANEPNTPPAVGLHDEMHIWRFHVDWNNPANSTFGVGSSAPAAKPGFSGQFAGNAGTPNSVLPIADFLQSACQIENGPNDCSPQPVTQGQPPQYLDVLGDRLMFRVTYRNFGDHESLLLSHTVDAQADQPMGVGRNGVRWYEVRNLSATPTVYQQGTFAPFDPAATTGPLWRWMGSAAMDHAGNIAIGYTASGPNYFPSVHYAGRQASDPLNQLSQGEAVMFVGQGIEANTGIFPFRNRWGDYSAMTIDPSDDCTFWYTNEYLVSAVGDILPVDWHTRIGSFKFPNCTATMTPQLVTVVSRKIHGAATFDIDLPLTGTRGVECRSGGAGNEHTLVFTFSTPITSCGTASTGTASSGPEANQCTVHLTGVPNGQYTTVTLNNVVSSTGGVASNLSATMGVLYGDVTANGAVSNTDVSQVKGQVSAPLTTSNFRDDITVNGAISNTDVSETKGQVGTTLPSPP